MKKLVLVFMAGITVATTQAQVQFGVKAGGNFATQTGSDAGESRTLFSGNAGVFLKLPVQRGVSVQPELVYSGQGARYDVNRVTSSYHANYLNIPILLKFTHGSGAYLETGPQFGFLTSASVHEGGNSTNDKDSYHSSDFAWVFGVGYKIPQSPVGIDFRYNVGLSNVQDRDFTGNDGSIRNDVLQLGLTYVLFKSSRR
jgi:hypothetical protein